MCLLQEGAVEKIKAKIQNKTFDIIFFLLFLTSLQNSTNTLTSSSFRLTGGGGLQRNNSTKEADPSGRIFRRGAVYRGIYLPSLSGKLQAKSL